MSEKIEAMCAALKRYYQFLGAGDEYDDTFAGYCEDNGLDDEMMEEEVENELNEPGSSLLADFEDDAFPFQDSNLSDDEKKKVIGEIIVKCYQNPDCQWDVASLPKC